MNKKPFFIYCIITLLLLESCAGNSSSSAKNLDNLMLDISEFTMNDSILKDGDKVEVIGCSGNVTKDQKIDFYNLVVVKSLETGDTVNVLVTTFFLVDPNDREVTFLSNTSISGKLMENFDNLDELNNENINKLKSKKFKKVLYDREYIEIDVKEYPSITGTLGDYTITENK